MKDKIFSVLQRVGRSFMLPIAILPVAGLLLGIGSSFTNATTIETYGLTSLLGNGTILHALLVIMNKVGSAVFDNLPLIFAVGVAIGMAKKEKEVSALSAVIAYFVMNTAINAMLTITGQILENGEIAESVLEGTRVLREQNGKLCLNPERRTERFRKKAGAARHFLAVQLVEQKIERDLIFRGEAVSMKGCERCFHTLQQGIIRGAVRDGNRAERGSAGGNSAGSRIGEGIVERDGRRGYLGVEPFLHIRGKPAVLTRGKERGKIPEQQGEKKSAAQKQREQDAAVQRSWFHRIGSGADSYHKVCKKC